MVGHFVYGLFLDDLFCGFGLMAAEASDLGPSLFGWRVRLLSRCRGGWLST